MKLFSSLKYFTQKRCKLSLQCNRGSAIVEFALSCLLIFMFTMSIIEYGRLLVLKQMAMISAREAVNVAARGGTMNQVVASISNTTSLLNIASDGQIVITRVQWAGGALSVARQQLQPSVQKYASRIAIQTGTNPTSWDLAGVPSTVSDLLQRLPAGHAAYFVEVISPFKSLTPLGSFMNRSTVYGVVFFAM